MVLLPVLLIISLWVVSISCRFPLLYNTKRISKAQFDCFYAHIANDYQKKHESFIRTYQTTPYCIRPSVDDWMINTSTVFGNIRNTISFADLRRQRVENHQLLIWSASIDLAEDYAMYLITNNTQFDRTDFYNCSSSWFGARCQYTFGSTAPIHSFGDFVRTTFENRSQFSKQLIIHTCYPHLPECQRGPAPMCLDWREICDGKVDCIGESFELDEKQCDELEVNECGENQYRCHNGAQCIPLDFVHDGMSSKDCLDGTDELETTFTYTPWKPLLVVECIKTTTFLCEEITCRRPRSFSCGDGDCDELLSINSNSGFCKGTGRDRSWNQAMLTSFDHLSPGCAKALFCALRFYEDFSNIYNEQQCSIIDRLPLANNCSQRYVRFPAQPILFDYFQFVYRTDRLSHGLGDNILPDLVCNDPRQCLHLPNEKSKMNGLDCRSPLHFFSGSVEHWAFFEPQLRDIMHACATIGDESQCASHPSLFHCERSKKCISKHRLVDGIDDCYHKEDETFTDSCSLNDSQRFNCTSEIKCLSPISIGPTKPDCLGEEDKLADIEIASPFTRLCNLIPEYSDNGTQLSDETHCEWWPCSNPYTRCDNIYQCNNGFDELNCTNSKCGPNEHMCYIESSEKPLCIPLAHIYEETISCNISIHPNQDVCRKVLYSNHTSNNVQRLSWSRKRCILDNDICGRQVSTEEYPMCKPESQHRKVCFGSLINEKNDQPLCSLTNGRTPPKDIPFFSSLSLGSFPPMTTESLLHPGHIRETDEKAEPFTASSELHTYCNRGILVFEGQSYSKKCVCPPSYFGSRCQWQSERVSLTLRFQQMTSSVRQTATYHILISLIGDDKRIMNDYEEMIYMSVRDCNAKYNIYVLYPTRPKNNIHNYTVHIDAFSMTTLDYHASWHLPIPFLFLPVNRLAAQILIPIEKAQSAIECPLRCGDYGQCFQYTNSTEYFCQCVAGYSGSLCNNTHECSCAVGSRCLSSSRCLCPLNKFGSRCHLRQTPCEPDNPCAHNGQCLPVDHRIAGDEFSCLCTEEYMGPRCEQVRTRIDIAMNIFAVPHSLIVHFITAYDKTKHERRTVFKKIPFDHSSTTLFASQPFNLLFIEVSDIYYLAVRRETYIPSERISAEIQSSYSCPNITQLLNSTLLAYPHLRRLKYYQLPCREHHQLKCFYDNELMCVCDHHRYANCFEFNHNTLYNCRGINRCENEGKCFQDNFTCPTRSMCMCDECFYGSQCQFMTKGISLSFDAIFGYYVKPSVIFSRQSLSVKVNVALTTLMFAFGSISGTLSVLTFQSKEPLKVGCGTYLLASSIISILTISVFYIKFWQLILFQMNLITNRSILAVNCVATDALLKVLLTTSDWLHACVAIERAFCAIQGVRFDKMKSKHLAKWAIPAIIVWTTLTHTHDPIHRRLMDEEEEEEQRVWCIIRYSTAFKTFDTCINIFHFLIPFVINMISAFVILVTLARSRAIVQQNETLEQHLRAQFKQHKHLFISPCILVILALPRLPISFLSGCMKSGRDPWLFLAGYYISFVPPILIFVVFVLPSEKYKKDFVTAMTKMKRRLCL